MVIGESHRAKRSRWRFTFQRLAREAELGLRDEADPEPGASALVRLIDLACSMRDSDYVRSEDPVEAARFVVSDAVTALWRALLSRHGFAGFAERAAPQLIRWESRYGWTRHGWVSLTIVLADMLQIPDTWITFSDHYLGALDEVARAEQTDPKRRHAGFPKDWSRRKRAETLAEWHDLLLQKLAAYQADDRLDRLAQHPALAGPELGLVQARISKHHGDIQRARILIQDGLRELPGHQGLLEFAVEVGVPLPDSSQRLVRERCLR